MEGLQTVIDVHRRWATKRNERMGIILEVTHTDGRGFSAVVQLRKSDVSAGRSGR